MYFYHDTYDNKVARVNASTKEEAVNALRKQMLNSPQGREYVLLESTARLKSFMTVEVADGSTSGEHAK